MACEFCAMQQGMLSRVSAALSRPSDTMSWGQLAAAAVFVVTVLLMWRQVIRWGMNEL